MLSSCAQFCIYFLDFHTEKNEGNTEPTLGIKPKYVTEMFVGKENADISLHIIHTMSSVQSSPASQTFRYKKGRCRLWVRGCSVFLVLEGEWSVRANGSQ